MCWFISTPQSGGCWELRRIEANQPELYHQCEAAAPKKNVIPAHINKGLICKIANGFFENTETDALMKQTSRTLVHCSAFNTKSKIEQQTALLWTHHLCVVSNWMSNLWSAPVWLTVVKHHCKVIFSEACLLASLRGRDTNAELPPCPGQGWVDGCEAATGQGWLVAQCVKCSAAARALSCSLAALLC